MSEKQTHIMNHFIQKALAKNFSINGNVHWVRYGTAEGGTFHINNSPYSKQPIVKKNFYSQKIEVGMNILESDGIKVLNKIALQANGMDEISINRKELVCLKFYSLLSSVRTDKLRNNIDQLSGDSLFNEGVKKDGRDAQIIQEERISVILEKYKQNREFFFGIDPEELHEGMDLKSYVSDNKGSSQENLMREFQKNSSPKRDELISIYNTLNSRLLIFKFKQPKLFLTESLSFSENRPDGGIAYSFMPIAPNVGIGFYFDPVISRGILKPYKSKIFENDISYRRHKNIYVNMEKILQEQEKFLNLSNSKTYDELQKNNKLFQLKEMHKYYDENDEYIYEVLNEKSEIADLCNAMAMVHNDKQILIYQKKKHILEAEAEIKDKNIFRIEDYQ